MERTAFRPKPEIAHKLTVSIGIAPAPRSGRMIDIMNQADRSLYGAKRTGRNRVAFRPRDDDDQQEIFSEPAHSKAS